MKQSPQLRSQHPSEDLQVRGLEGAQGSQCVSNGHFSPGPLCLKHGFANAMRDALTEHDSTIPNKKHQMPRLSLQN